MIRPTVYLLYSNKDHRTYVGSTNNIERRIREHKDGKCISTKNRRPLCLIYSEEYDSIVEARKREHYFKSHAGRKELGRIIENHIGE
jgi:putative endonuclease